ncbi:hypothetical protein N1037_13605 [Phaeobacter sp. G2]|nr:hypothetical protein N1037_13605 [Phaeobacter sp. G2]
MFKALLEGLFGTPSKVEESSSPATVQTNTRSVQAPASAKQKLTFNPDTITSDTIDEAFEHLGLLKPSAKPSIEAAIHRCMAEGFKAVALSHRKDGKQLSKEAKKALGIRSNAFMSKRAASELSEKGKLKPLEAHFLTLWRADFTIDRAKRILTASGHEFGSISQLGAHRDGCAFCTENYDSYIDPFTASPFPPAECPNAACGMMYHASVDWVAVHKSRR